ncbi:hypothetical protein Poli38472_009746 [Pythium oligandrum]|uniref:WRKY19-like zinc finger domain-containing protein n=1 Tax=Pythium oligandrum TaxID=41045 RepID=A0A8K1CFV1_PYTOL|nr:hypothetical protein Poli38472_009746 [Pythium oligandrum]|eukprot:TMW62253.1 hypothetical protein Poli38472_009746 [Pythium oligandrum]
MRTKEALDRETQEEQERTWIHLLHQQNPPLSTSSGLIPLAPMVSHTASPLVAARAAAASMALHVNTASTPTASGSSWALPSLTTEGARTTETVYGGMVRLEKKTYNTGLLELLPKRRRDDEDDVDEEFQEDDAEAKTAGGGGSKRACLPKKCDFPMCKNSSRSRGFCYSHGGGRRCRVDGCCNGAVSRDLCKRHGGGRRCRIAGCKSSSESGGLCYSHGGGRRCNLSWCNARAKKGGYCAAHVDNRDAPPPADLVESSPEPATTKPVASVPQDTVNPLVIETLLSLSKSPPQSETEEDSEASRSPTSPASSLLSPRLSNPYALASILN